jgi:hypothetical protein
VWSEQSAEIRAAVVGKHGGQIVVPDHKIMLVACQAEEEAHYVAGVINSMPFRYGVASYAIEIQMGPHILENLRIPEFDSKKKIHRDIADEAKRLAAAHKAADESALLDSLCAQLWGIGEKELKAITNAHQELHQVRNSAEQDAAESPAE